MGRNKELNKLRKRMYHGNQDGDRGARGNSSSAVGGRASSTAGNGQGALWVCVRVCVYVCGVGRGYMFYFFCAMLLERVLLFGGFVCVVRTQQVRSIEHRSWERRTFSIRM